MKKMTREKKKIHFELFESNIIDVYMVYLETNIQQKEARNDAYDSPTIDVIFEESSVLIHTSNFS